MDRSVLSAGLAKCAHAGHSERLDLGADEARGQSASRFKKGLWAGRGLGRRRLDEVLVVEKYEPAAMLDRLRAGSAFVAIAFTGHTPKKEAAIDVSVQRQVLAFPIDEPGVVCLPPGGYTITLVRGGALKAGTVHLVSGEVLLLRFNFSAMGITWSGWGHGEAWTFGRLPTELPATGS